MSNLSSPGEASTLWSHLLRAVSLGRLPVERTGITYSSTVPEMIRSQAARQPSAPAVCQGGRSICYEELEHRAELVARYLESSGIAPGNVVALWFDRSPGFVCAALGVWKARCAYVPLDTSWPRQRVEYILRDSEAPVVLTCSACVSTVPSEKCETLLIESLPGADKRRASRPRCAPEAGDLAYVIYTSGSTGKPKGVEISHGNLRHLVLWHQAAFALSRGDRTSMYSSLGFDASVWEIWPALASGASLQIPSEEIRIAAPLLRDWLVAQQITISFVPTLIAEQLLLLDWPASTALRFLLTGADCLQSYARPGLPFALVNNYGPTECTVVTTSGIVPVDPNDSAEPPSIGKPIGETLVFVLDENLRPVAEGQIGELCVAGPSVGRGYRNDAALTAEKFVPYLFSSGESGRLYRTGDLVRMRADGEIGFVGRIDDQVKIQGYRVEPNEVRSVLASHPAVCSCYVVAHKNGAGTVSLVAYVVFRAGQSASSNELREYLRSSLPEYMIPTQFIALEAMPLSAAGKIDRAALPAPCPSNALAEEEPSAGQNFLTQSRLLPILEELLQQPVGPHDNFFLLGGHSLLGAQLILRIQEAFAVLLTLRDIFDHPTAAGIAIQIERAQSDAKAWTAALVQREPFPWEERPQAS